METKEFTIVHLSHLKIDDLYSLIKSSIGYADPVKVNIGEMPNAILVRLATDHHAMEVQMNKALKSALTPQLTQMNADREDRFGEIKRNVTTALKGRDEEKKAAANNLKIFLDPYWDTDKKALNTQTGIYSGMLGKFGENESLLANADTIGISQMMEGLAESNNAFEEVYQNRLTQEAVAEGPAATSLRAAATKSYVHFCTSIEQAVNFMPSEVLTTLFNQLDELRKTYARLVHTEDEDPGETPPPAQ
jgi:hypothetical protein